MGYLEDFLTQIANRDFSKFLQLWEEYCTSDTVEVEEFIDLLKAIKTSDFAKHFGQFVETALPLWQTIQDKKGSYETLKHLIDLQTTNSPILAETAFDVLQARHGSHSLFHERLRLVGMRNKENFQGAIANYDLLDHMEKGKFVFHTGGWGTGEIVDMSPVREQLAIEFENVAGRKHLTFVNAFKTLIPLPDDNFLARRFSDPDLLEKDARENPVDVIKLLLRDLGPKTAAEIKDELCDLVIPEKDWTKWWQAARTKLKKDTMIETPATLRDPFKLRKAEVSHEDQLLKLLETKHDIAGIIQTTYSCVRDLPNVLKKLEVKNSLKDKLLGLLSDPALTRAQELQVHLLLEQQFGHEFKDKAFEKIIQNLKDIEAVVEDIEIIAFKKRVLTIIRSIRDDWSDIFLGLLFKVAQSTLREYLAKELSRGETRVRLIEKLENLLENPMQYPELYVWYFQTIVGKDADNLPFADKEGRCRFFESFLILFSNLEGKPEYRDLSKKMYTMLSGKRYALIREIIEGTSLEFLKEFLLLVAKCQSLSDHDVKIMRSLAAVVHPSLAEPKSSKHHHHADGQTIWTTEEGYLKTQDRVRHIGTVEMVETAREIEAARALGDLRENSEYKFAQEKRHRLQGEMKTLSEQLGRARIITKDDVNPTAVDVGSIITLQDSKDNKITYTILGPWDANPDENILSFQSKLAQAMVGLKESENFSFRDEDYTILKLSNVFEK